MVLAEGPMKIGWVRVARNVGDFLNGELLSLQVAARQFHSEFQQHRFIGDTLFSKTTTQGALAHYEL